MMYFLSSTVFAIYFFTSGNWYVFITWIGRFCLAHFDVDVYVSQIWV